MTSSSTVSSPPIILLPAEQAASINSGPGVSVRYTKTDFSLTKGTGRYTDLFLLEVRELFTFHPKEWLNAFKPNPKFPLFVLGDIDGFVALFMNNLATLLAVILGLKVVFSDELIYRKIVPG